MHDSLCLPGGYEERLTLREDVRVRSNHIFRWGILDLED